MDEAQRSIEIDDTHDGGGMQGTKSRGHSWRFGEVTLDVARRRVLVGEKEVSLRPRSFDVLKYLVEHQGVLVTKRELHDAVWGDAIVTDGVLAQSLLEIRKALNDRSRRVIRTVPSRGYILELPARGENGQPAFRRKVHWLAAAGVGLLGIVGFLAYLGTSQDPEPGIAGADGETRQALPEPGPPGAVVPTIAVLPFEDLSPEQDLTWFGDGVAEDILVSLTRLPELRVIARTSSFHFRSRPFDVSDITQRLGVTHILDGSLRASGDRLRIAVHLVETSTEREVWSNSYDRNSDDTFAVQEDIAANVARALEVTMLTPVAGSHNVPPDSEAYAHYLQGQHFYIRRGPGDVELAEHHYRRAVQIDPEFGRAWAGLAAVAMNSFYDHNFDYDEGIAAMGDAVQQALRYAPDFPETHLRAGRYYYFRGDPESANRHYRRAARLGPNDPLVIGITAENHDWRGEHEEAVPLYHRALGLDPLNGATRNNLAMSLIAVGRYDEAEEQIRRRMALDPRTAPRYEFQMAFFLILREHYEEALEAMLALEDGKQRDFGLTLVWHALGQAAESDSALARLQSADRCWSAARVASVYAHRGQSEDAFGVIEAFLTRQQSIELTAEKRTCLDEFLSGLSRSPFLMPLRSDPRWEALFDSADAQLLSRPFRPAPGS